MDTEAIYSEIAAYGRAKARGRIYEEDTEHHLAEIKRLLNEADEEHKSLLAENERLVDEVNEARKEISEQARLNGMGAEREARLMAEVSELKAKLTDKASLLRGCYAADHKQKQRIAELESAVAEAIPAMRDYARKNPKHYFEEAMQDPCGGHGWLAKHDAALQEDKT